MKTLLTIIIITALTTTATAQSLMLSVRRSVVKSEMNRLPDFTQTADLQDYLEYERGSQTVAYEFEQSGHKWLCSSASITMPEVDQDEFIQSKLDCSCWCPIEADTWRYETNIFDATVIVTRTVSGERVTFTYEF